MKKSSRNVGGLVFAVITTALFLFSCANPVLDSTSFAKVGSRNLAVDPLSYTLYAGQTINAGSVTLTQDANNLYITYTLNEGLTLLETHVWVGSAPIDVAGRPSPGQYDKDDPVYVANRFFGSQVNVNGVVTVPLTDAIRNSPSLVIYTHASLSDGNTAFAGNFAAGGAGGWFRRIDTTLGEVPFVTPPEPPVTTTTTVPPEVVYQTIDGVVFHDYNGNGELDSGEPGLPGVTVSLSNGNETSTASDGSYSFGGLLAQNYTVTVGSVAGFFPTPYDTPEVSTTVTASASEVNFGFSYESISGFTFRDYSADGVKDSGEPAIAGVSVSLSGGAVASVVSGSNGSYVFDHLKGGSVSYTVTAGSVSGEFHTPYLAPVSSWTGEASASDVNFGYSHETVQGVVFFDANKNGVYDFGEPTLEGFDVSLSNGSSTSSASDGSYVFDNLPGATTYVVTAADKTGFLHSGASSVSVTPEGSVPAVANFGFVVDYSWIVGKTANGFTIGYWKTNLDKAIANKTAGTQVSKATLTSYVNALSSFQLAPLNVTTLKAASDILSKTGSNPADLLAKQLMGSELNYQNAAYIGGNALATYFFLYDGEYMLDNPTLFSSAELLAQKDRYDAYNNSHGGAVIF